MTLFEKLGFFAIIGVFIIIQIFTIATKFSGTRVIVVKKEDYSKQIDTVTKDSIQKVAVETFHFKVRPNTFWDKLLLIDDDDNLLSLLFKIICGLAVGWYIYRLQFDNIFSKRKLDFFWLICCFVWCVILARDIGISHTRDFWIDRYLSKGGSKETSYEFFSNNIWVWSYYWYFFMAFYLYKSFVEHHTEKNAEAKSLNNETLNTYK